MAHQFKKPTYCAGISVARFNRCKPIRCIVGKEKRPIIVDENDVTRLIDKYGPHRIVRMVKGERIYVLPLQEFSPADNVGYKDLPLFN